MQTKLTVQKALIYQWVTANPRLIFYVDYVEEKFYNISLWRESPVPLGTFPVLNSAVFFCLLFEYFTRRLSGVKSFGEDLGRVRTVKRGRRELEYFTIVSSI